ncbi:MetQ/NlpA family ABC transporter substrate-binding protein [Pandoraea sputorum]|uniref:Lipoprotein n=7 Tax=Pandoraea sputorum TaxID=93222 RepID=A0A239SE93_9BURK|nr:MetQ/NlpA family ABC transporter substrate-binding protein [Pandoraea sputorum]AJC16626.1 metal ABC transporter substrate-binding protein [Pandoraea sputorum]SNU83711.1 D-methionine-binding lipoprotein metQ precursor [Pandoraea sputorum]VVD95893.1 metal ABC transporter substrate-binding protein [Pandoraea sputorum]VVE77246.1 metal ABC transporter substrate-binding protein [Pandoraea sputorum]VVE79940.1 metal ABC transporter substrate-binding protein [Pandoraea sputorum]
MLSRQLINAFLGATFALASLGASAQTADKPLKVGTMAGSDAQIFEVVKKVAEKRGLFIKIVEFSDYAQPNAALDAGDLDANGFQHKPFLDSQVKDRGYKISTAGLTYVSPLGFYSKKYKSLKDLPNGAQIGIQNDPSNGSRALRLLAKEGLIKVKPGLDGKNITPLDIENPKKFKIRELEAAQLPRALPDLDAASINTNFAAQAGLVPKRDAIAIEDLKGPYANLIAVRTQDLNKPWVKQLVDAYHSDEVKQFIDTQFKGALIATW